MRYYRIIIEDVTVLYKRCDTEDLIEAVGLLALMPAGDNWSLQTITKEEYYNGVGIN